MERMSQFYRTVLGLKQVTAEKGWREFEAGVVRIALHSGPASPGRKDGFCVHANASVPTPNRNRSLSGNHRRSCSSNSARLLSTFNNRVAARHAYTWHSHELFAASPDAIYCS